MMDRGTRCPHIVFCHVERSRNISLILLRRIVRSLDYVRDDRRNETYRLKIAVPVMLSVVETSP